jgi:hypothetical protein
MFLYSSGLQASHQNQCVLHSQGVMCCAEELKTTSLMVIMMVKWWVMMMMMMMSSLPAPESELIWPCGLAEGV